MVPVSAIGNLLSQKVRKTPHTVINLWFFLSWLPIKDLGLAICRQSLEAKVLGHFGNLILAPRNTKKHIIFEVVTKSSPEERQFALRVQQDSVGEGVLLLGEAP